MLDKLSCDILCIHVGEKVFAVLLVEFHQHIGGNFAVKKVQQILRLFQVKFPIEIGDVGGMHVLKLLACFLVVMCRYDIT